MFHPKPQRQSEWANLQDRSQPGGIEIQQQGPSPAPIDPERIHDARGLKILIAVVALGAALAIAWVTQSKAGQNKFMQTGPAATRTQQSAPSQGVTVISGPQHASGKAAPAKPIRKAPIKPAQSK